MAADAKKEIGLIIREMRRRGFIVDQQKRGGHWRISNPDTGVAITCANSPSDSLAPQYVRNDIKKIFGIDLTKKAPARKKGTADDYALQRLRDRALNQMGRGATVADLARMSVAANEDKRIGGWTKFNSAEVGIGGFLKGSRLMKQNHDTLASALSTLESAAEAHVFERHLDKAAQRFGAKRMKQYNDSAKPEAAPKEPEEESVVALAGIEPEREGANPDLPSAPQGTITLRIEIDPETRAWLTNLLGGLPRVFAD